MVFVLKGEAGREALDRWISWARRCRIPAFVDLQKRIVRHRKTIDATLEHGLSNACASYCTSCRGCEGTDFVGLVAA
jgi:transposase